MNWEYYGGLRVCGTPKAQPRPRAYVRGGSVSIYTPSVAKAWKEDLIAGALEQLPRRTLEGPVRVDTIFLLPRPKRLMRKRDPEGRIPHTSKPDVENLYKVILDALTAAGAYVDDAQVCEGRILKFYHAKRDKPGAIITIYKANEQENPAVIKKAAPEGVRPHT